MDIACTFCGEPWDIDSLHDAAKERLDRLRDTLGEADYPPEGLPTYERVFAQVRTDFLRRGCKALGEAHTEPRLTTRATVASALADIMGDDLDGMASALEDAEYMGILD